MGLVLRSKNTETTNILCEDNLLRTKLIYLKPLCFPYSNTRKIFRFFSEKSHAIDFMDGKIRLSTLSICRSYEDSLQGDSGEGIENRHIDYLNITSENSDKVNQVIGNFISIEGCGSALFENCTFTNQIDDAFVLCFTNSFKDDDLTKNFGKYCVEITNPLDLFYKISKEINNQFTINQGVMGKITYADRNLKNLNPANGPLGFVKPKDPYEPQNELRMLWHINTKELPLTPKFIKIPSIQKHCRLTIHD